MQTVYNILLLQSEHDEIEAKFFEERAALELKYQKLYAPLYSKVCICRHELDRKTLVILNFK